MVCDDAGEHGKLGGNDGRATSRKKPGKGGYSGEAGMTSFLGLKGEEEQSYEGNSVFSLLLGEDKYGNMDQNQKGEKQ